MGNASQPAEAEGVDIIGYMDGDYRRDQPSIYIPHVRIVKSCAKGEALMTVTQHLAALSAVTAERDRLAEQASKFRLVERAMEALGCDEREGGIVTAASLILISSAHRMNAKRGVIDQEGVTLDGGCIGDWRVTIERISAAMAAKEA